MFIIARIIRIFARYCVLYTDERNEFVHKNKYLLPRFDGIDYFLSEH